MGARGLITFLISQCTFLLLVNSRELYMNRMREAEYDYIIVGAGSAGAVVANRLSEDVGTSVLLLEAGGPPSGLSEVPFFFDKLMNTEMDWAYYTEPQENACQGLKDKRSFHPRGKALGGTSIINAMMYVRGNRRDFDEWARQGATGWSWQDVFYYFKKSEDQRDPEIADNGFHGRDGYLSVSPNTHVTPLRDAYFEAGKHLGYDTVDINVDQPLGFARMQGTIRDGLRCSTEKAFLRPAADRENLDILVHAHVTQVLFDEDKRAHSVRFEQNNASRVVSARKEIILSAGVVGTPQLLMLSGVGPKEHLQELGIPVIADLPVGQNLQDHITHGGQVYLINTTDSMVHSRFMNHKHIGELLAGKGPLTVPVGCEGMAFLNTKYQPASENWPDMQFFFLSTLFLPPVDDSLKAFKAGIQDKDAITMYPMLSRPKARGFIKLRSKNPYEHPIIDPRYLSVEDDLLRLVEGMKIVERIIQSPSMQKYGPVRIPETIPGCEKLNIKDNEDDFLRCMARSLTLTTYHQCGTCKMGDPNNPDTVVDPQLRVKGVKGLRVADGSIMPAVTSGNTNAPCIMIGEKAADMIRGRIWDPILQQIVTQ